ncbi:MAG: DNA-binding transcriptional regulator, partial [Phycisphaeraceae bacterium]
TVAIGGGRGGYSFDEQLPYVFSSHEAVGRVAAEHLIDRGFRNFAYCGMPRTAFNPWSQGRCEAFSQRIAEKGHTCHTYTGRHQTPRQWESLQKDLTDWIKTLPLPVGLMACNDARARHVLEACRRAELRVPEDVAVLGVDNDEMMCELSSPPLSSVIQATDRVGYQAALMLDKLMDGQTLEQRVVEVSPLGVATRHSTDVLAVQDAKVAEAIALIRDRACEPLQVRDVLAHAGLSRATLEVRFKRVLGRTIHSEIQRVQIATASELLAMTDVPIKTVAERVGFKYVQYLTTVFRRATGYTPAAFRRRSRQ